MFVCVCLRVTPPWWCHPSRFIYLLLNLSNKVKRPGDILLRLPLPDTQLSSHRQTHRLLSPKHLQSCRCPPANWNPACPSYKVIEFHATAAATSDYQVAWLYSPILIHLNHLPEKHSQRGTQIHTYVCQTKPISEITTFQKCPPQEYTCTDTHG